MKRKRRPVTDKDRQQILDLYEAGIKLNDIYKKTGRGPGAVQYVLNKAGVARRYSIGAKQTARAPRRPAAAVRNTRPAKANGQTGAAATELREAIGRKREELDALEKALVIVEASL